MLGFLFGGGDMIVLVVACGGVRCWYIGVWGVELLVGVWGAGTLGVRGVVLLVEVWGACILWGVGDMLVLVVACGGVGCWYIGGTGCSVTCWGVRCWVLVHWGYGV